MYHIQVDDLSGYCCARENKMIYIIIGLIGAMEVMNCGKKLHVIMLKVLMQYNL